MTRADTSSDALPVEPLMTDCAADALADAAAAVVSAAVEMALAEFVLAGEGKLGALDALEIVDIKMLRTSGLLLSLGLDEHRPLKTSFRRASRDAIRCDAMPQPRVIRAVHRVSAPSWLRTSIKGESMSNTRLPKVLSKSLKRFQRVYPADLRSPTRGSPAFFDFYLIIFSRMLPRRRQRPVPFYRGIVLALRGPNEIRVEDE
ncbi:hypothetical protein [Caballeronia sp. 15711]|uniref:hypothetical protein n=1 Tax=Caballeronia sp. 15711 TaxID=3391029 RepID=UPI0039E61D68